MNGDTAARLAVADAISAATALWDRVASGGSPDAAAATRVVAGLAASIDAGPDALGLVLSEPRNPAVVPHMIRVAMLTLALGTAIGVRGPLRLAFGSAALLHDIGKTRTPRDILDAVTPLTPDQRRVLEHHVWDGAAILRDTPGLSGLAALVALEHHVREDGSGYPARTPPRRLNACTSMVNIADVFDALRTGRPDRGPLTTAAALALMQGERRSQFHQALLARFAGVVGESGTPPRPTLVAHVEHS